MTDPVTSKPCTHFAQQNMQGTLTAGFFSCPWCENDRLRGALQRIVSEGDYTAPGGMKRIARAAIGRVTPETPQPASKNEVAQDLEIIARNLQNNLTVSERLTLTAAVCALRAPGETSERCLSAGCTKPPMRAAFCEEHNAKVPSEKAEMRCRCGEVEVWAYTHSIETRTGTHYPDRACTGAALKATATPATFPIHADPTGKTREPPHCPTCSCGQPEGT